MNRLFACVAVLELVGCAKSTQISTPFSTDWLSDSGQSIAAVEASLRNAPRPRNQAVVLAITDRALQGVSLASGQRWSYAAAPDSAPSVAGDLVLFTSKGVLHALDAGSGKSRFQVSVEDMVLKGAGDDGSTTVVTLGTFDGRRSLFLALDHAGHEKTRLPTSIALGRPAVLGGVAFIPWSGQYVSAIDTSNSEELGRLLTREVVSHAFTAGGELFFGERAVLHFDQRIRDASTRQSGRVALPERVLPGQPRWLGPGSEVSIVDPSARAKIRLYASPRYDGQQVSFASNAFLATYFRAVMSFDAKTAELRAVQALPGAVLGGSAARSGFVLCGADGKVTYFGTQGGVLDGPDFKTPVRGCVVEANEFELPKTNSAGTLAAQLDRTLLSLEPEMAAAQAFLMTELGRLPDPSVSKTLIDLASSARLAPDLRARARQLLAQRRAGAEFMLAALERRYDFLASDALPPPVGPLADALAAMNEKRAAPLLARHLSDPATELADLEHAAKALETLATAAELPSLKTFFALYRATADEAPLVAAVVSVARALVRVGGPEERALVERAQHDPLTQPDVARDLAGV
ncbi:MAG TPA: hypothetical protein VFQ61_25640 [Polyangiaceae bacterium]|nr:hypothetical protein [Polyangiaceae bacterium]